MNTNHALYKKICGTTTIVNFKQYLWWKSLTTSFIDLIKWNQNQFLTNNTERMKTFRIYTAVYFSRMPASRMERQQWITL